MGLFLEILQFQDPTGNTMVARVPAEGPADINSGSQLVVNESQAAVFFTDGQARDTFGPGRHTITTQNIPVLTKLLSLPFGFKSPFQAYVYFVSLKTFSNLKWGTKEPIAFRDSELMMVRLRAFGNFSIKVKDPRIFIAEVVGTRGFSSAAEVERDLKDIIVQRLNDLLGETLKTILDLPQHYNEIAVGLKAKVADSFGKLGIECTDLVLGAITPPEEVQKMMDKRAQMAIVGDMNKYMQFQAAENMQHFAKSGGGMAAMGANVGMGLGMGNMMAQAFQPQMQQMAPPPMAQAAPAGPPCAKCGTPVPGKFCNNCGTPAAPPQAAGVKCPGCGQPAAGKFCNNCGASLGPKKCSGCQAELGPGAKFCNECGAKA